MESAPLQATTTLPPLRDRRRAATRTEIAAAALMLFERQGYDETTVEQIATAAGVSMRTFYRYCSSKEEALGAGLTAGPGQLVEAIAAREALPLIDAVVAGFLAVSDTMSRRRELQLVLHAPALRAAWLAAGRSAQDDLVDVLTRRLPDAPGIEVRAPKD